jgi:hypothetical protein
MSSGRAWYGTQSRVTDPGPFAGCLDAVPPGLAAMQATARQLVFHYRAGGDYAENGIDPGRIAEIDTRYADAMLARLASPRPPGLAALTCDTQVCTVTGSTARWPGAPRCSATAGPC